MEGDFWELLGSLTKQLTCYMMLSACLHISIAGSPGRLENLCSCSGQPSFLSVCAFRLLLSFFFFFLQQ